MRISDWSSDVCSSDLHLGDHCVGGGLHVLACHVHPAADLVRHANADEIFARASSGNRAGTIVGIGSRANDRRIDRKSVVEGKRVSVRVALVGLRSSNKKKLKTRNKEDNRTTTD